MPEPLDSPFVSSLAHHASNPFRLLVESVVEYAIFMMDPVGNIASWNPGAERIYGYDAAEIIGKPVEVLCSEDSPRDGPAAARQGAIESGYYAQECIVRRKDGSEFLAEITTSNLKDYFGIHAGFSMVTRDITERRNAEERLRTERDLLDAILDSLPGVYYMYDEERRFMRWNRRLEDLTGYSAEEIRALDPLDLFDGEYRERVAAAIGVVFRTGYGQVEALVASRSGKRTPYYFTGVRAVIDGTTCLLGMGIDISDQMRAQQELRANDERMQQAARAGNVGLWDMDLATGTVFYSREWKRQLGYEDHEIGTSAREWEDRLHPEDRTAALEAMSEFLSKQATPGFHREFRLRHRDGSYRRLLAQASFLFDQGNQPIRLLGSQIDVTEQRRLEEQIQKTQKMEAVGQLAAGVAHDFNNFVTVINGYSDLVLANEELPEGLRSHVTAIRDAGLRAGNLTRQLLSFARKQVVSPRVLNPNTVVANTETMLYQLIGDGVTLVTRLSPATPEVLADTGQLEVVLVNLAVNGRDAMPGGGTLTIATRGSAILDGGPGSPEVPPPGQYSLITVSDTGTGIDAETQANIFEPFFTTKAAGSGTGLGLATVKSIVEQAGGYVTVESAIGRGTTFCLYLPAVETEDEETVSDEAS